MAALQSMRVLDMTQYEAGTSCTQALAWLGADVVKVERPGTGDPGRGPTLNSNYFLAWNSNKRSLTLDLSDPAGRDLLLKLVPHYDVFVENYGPGVIERLDLGYEVMKTINPGIICGRIKGFGTHGPYSDFKCFDMIAQSAAGAFSITGESDQPPLRPGPTTGDAGTGVQMALAITAAYVKKLETGEGQLIEVSMQEAMTYYVRTAMAGSDGGERLVPRNGNGAGPIVNLYPCAPHGINDYVFIMAVTQRMWESLCHAIERADLLADERFETGAKRYENREALQAEITEWSRQRDKYEAMRVLGEGGVPASAILDSLDLYRDPHLLSRGFVHTLDHPERGEIRLLGWGPRMGEGDVPMQPAPLLGAHTGEILAADLSLDQAELDHLRSSGIVG